MTLNNGQKNWSRLFEPLDRILSMPHILFLWTRHNPDKDFYLNGYLTREYIWNKVLGM